MTIAVYRVVSYWPDENRGNKKLYCTTSATGNWGDVPSGSYYFRVQNVDGWVDSWQVSADPVKVRY